MVINPPRPPLGRSPHRTTIPFRRGDKSYTLGLLRRIKQDKNKNVVIYAERLLNLAEDAFQGEGLNVAEQAPIERELVGYFTDGLCHDYLKIKVMRENPKE